MELDFLARGGLIGLVFGVPAGAIGAMAIRRTLSSGFRSGFCTGLGSSVADALYACAGVFGLTVITDFCTRYQRPIGLVGAALILLYGLSILWNARGQGTQTAQPARAMGGFISAFAVAILNPAAILSFMVAFSAFGLLGDYTFLQGAWLVLGVLLGTGLWWFGLCALVSLLKKRITPRIYRIIWFALGGLMMLFGVVMLVRNVV